MAFLLLTPNFPSQGRLLAVGLLLTLTALPSCNGGMDAVASDMGDGEQNAFCSSSWVGKLAYVGSELTFQACLKPGQCSGELRTRNLSAPHPELICTQVGDAPVSCDYGSAHLEPGPFGIHGMWDLDKAEPGRVDVNVIARYPLQLSDALNDDDRATLTIKAQDGAVLVDSVSSIPYERVGRCAGVAPDLSGLPRTEDVSTEPEP